MLQVRRQALRHEVMSPTSLQDVLIWGWAWGLLIYSLDTSWEKGAYPQVCIRNSTFMWFQESAQVRGAGSSLILPTSPCSLATQASCSLGAPGSISAQFSEISPLILAACSASLAHPVGQIFSSGTVSFFFNIFSRSLLNLLQYSFWCVVWFFGYAACGILFGNEDLTTRLPGEPLGQFLLLFIPFFLPSIVSFSF